MVLWVKWTKENLPRERWKWCHQEPCTPFHSQLYSTALCSSSPTPSASLSSTPLSVTRNEPSLMKAQTQLDADQKLKKWLTEYFAIVRLKELNGDKEVQKWLLSRLQSRRGACQQAKILSMQVNLPPWLTFRPFNKSFAICSLSKHYLSPIKSPILLPVGPPGIQTVKMSSTMFQTKIRFAFVRCVGRIWLGDKRSYLEENEDRVGDKEVVLMMKMSESKRELWEKEGCMGWELVVNDVFVWRRCLLSGTCVFWHVLVCSKSKWFTCRHYIPWAQWRRWVVSSSNTISCGSIIN